MDLAPLAVQLVTDDSEILLKVLRIVESYILLSPEPFLNVSCRPQPLCGGRSIADAPSFPCAALYRRTLMPSCGRLPSSSFASTTRLASRCSTRPTYSCSRVLRRSGHRRSTLLERWGRCSVSHFQACVTAPHAFGSICFADLVCVHTGTRNNRHPLPMHSFQDRHCRYQHIPRAAAWHHRESPGTGAGPQL